MEQDTPPRNDAGDGEVVSEGRASQGQKTGHIRWVLIIGTALAVAGLSAVWMAMGGFH